MTARIDLDDVQVEVDATLQRLVTAHHQVGPLRRGQERPVDLELHPGTIPGAGVSGMLRVVGTDGMDVAPPVRLTLATDPRLDCTLAGAVDGPWPPAEFDVAVGELLAGTGGPRRLARRVDALVAGEPDPGWSRMPWGRR
ncbi:MAG: hypothetical protein JWO69_846 [Thermoleophilia bacterium]|nr:hypothetical protein [Thermoleophilia bacterium]